MAMITRSRRLKDAKKAIICFSGQYFLFSKRVPRTAWSPATIVARASTQPPSSLPRMSQGATRTLPLLRMRLTLPVSPMV